MDIDLLKSASSEADQMEMMLMMHNLDKLPADFSPAAGDDYSDVVSHVQLMDSNNNITFMNHAPSNNISFAPPYQESPFPPDSVGKFRFSFKGEFSGNGDGGACCPRKGTSMAAMREMIFRIAAMQPIHIDPESVKPPKRRNVKISTDPQSVAARHRRERISEKIRTLQRLVPGGTKMDTASMLDEAIHYVKFLKNQVQSLERAGACRRPVGMGFPVPTAGSYMPASSTQGYHQSTQNVQHYGE